jgi:CheY-like chemotaxis protein
MRRDGARPVLLVDDDTNTLEAFGLLLKAEGCTVVATESASEGALSPFWP